MQFPMESKGEDSVNTPIFALPESGVVGVSIIAEEDTALYAASYMTDEEREKKEVKIGIGIYDNLYFSFKINRHTNRLNTCILSPFFSRKNIHICQEICFTTCIKQYSTL